MAGRPEQWCSGRFFFRRPHELRVDARRVPELPDYLNVHSHKIIGAAIEVHRHLGRGFLEKTYDEALAIELTLRGIRFERQVPFDVRYKGEVVAGSVLDFLVEREVVVELKAVEQLHEAHRAQLLSYVKAGGFRLGLLINFNVSLLRSGVVRMAL
jgi:GxxExxY protein